MKNYYAELDGALARYEKGGYKTHSISWITNRIDWCWRFRKITKQQMSSLCDRAMKLFD